MSPSLPNRSTARYHVGPRNLFNGFSWPIFLGLTVYLAALCSGQGQSIASYADDARNREWVVNNFRDQSGILPFSFTYGGQSSQKLLAGWPHVQSTQALDRTRTQYSLTWIDPETALEVRCVAVVYSDFPATEWTVYFKNKGNENTPILQDIQGLDARFERGNEGEFILNGIAGDWASAESYQPYQIVLKPGMTEERGPDRSGKSSDGRKGWPYYNLQQASGGILLAIGWPGQWHAAFERDSGQTLRIRAGQELTHCYLKPGEEVRSPLIAMLFWRGTDLADSQNLWRRWMVNHNVPRASDGQLPSDQILGNSSHQFSEMTEATEENQKQFIDAYLAHGIKLDYWWMDAGWYPCDGIWARTGTWEPDPKRFPRGLRPISDHALERGVRTVLWFEPERVGNPTSQLAKEHRDWLIENSASAPILNLGDPAALAWVIDRMDGLIRSQGVHFYREDMNSGSPLMAWRAHDSETRQGVTENLYVQAHLTLWDTLRQRHPDLRLDSCAGGGRRNDLESMRRAVPLLRSDYLFEPIGQQAHTFGLSNWLPYQGTGYLAGASVLGLPGSNGIDVYAFRSTICVSHTVSVDVRDPTVDWVLLKRLEDQHPQIGPLFLQDYYPLTAYSLSPDQWMAWQFNNPEKETGMIQAFRRGKNDEPEKIFKLRGLNPSATYRLTNFDVEGTSQFTGAQLMNDGLTVAVREKPAAVVITYRQLK